MATNKKISDENVESEIARLKESEYVKLAMAYQRRRKYMYQLRWLEGIGKSLSADGITIEQLSGDIDPEVMEAD